MAPAPASPTRERTALLAGWVRRALDAEPAAWFETTLSALAGAAGERDLARAVGLAPRKLGKSDLVACARRP